MNRIQTLFTSKRRDILSVYYPAGFPQLEDTLPILSELQSAGVDMVEIGIPFSDPMADGVVIQQAANQALHNGMSLRKLFLQLEKMRPQINLPVILMGYLNPVMQFGFEAFCQRCAEVGVDGMILPDLPFSDYVNTYRPIAERYNLKMIMLITPETSKERIRLIDEHTNGFIYMVSSASTTGAQESFDAEKQNYFERINGMNLKNPRLVGFGISNHSTLKAAQANSSGAIIGSKFVQLLQQTKTPREAIHQLFEALNK